MDKTYEITEIEGIGETYGNKLRAKGIPKTGELLERAGTKKGRVKLAEETGLPESLILTWVNHADLMRINGVGGQFAELLEAAGVDSVKELAHRNAENLHEKLVATNNELGLSGTTPSLDHLRKIIDQAKQMQPKVSH
jgi:predicted flap endonuclease-1-like 5' DNA nuclease